MLTLAEKLAMLREERKVSIKALADDAGVSESSIKRAEHGHPSRAETFRKIVVALHLHEPLTESDVFELANAGGYNRAGLYQRLERVGPILRDGAATPAPPIESWRTRCHSLVDRMLARAESPEQVELALVAMIAVFEQSVPTMGDGPILTRRGEVRQVAPGVLEQKVEHRRTGA